MSRFEFISKSTRGLNNFRQVELDEEPVFLDSSPGLKTLGISSCVTFAAYEGDKLLCIYRCDALSSEASGYQVDNIVDKYLLILEQALEMRGINLYNVTVYAIGGQESSMNLIEGLVRRFDSKEDTFTLDVTHLLKVPGEDSFDLFVRARTPKFHAVLHPFIPARKDQPQPIVHSLRLSQRSEMSDSGADNTSSCDTKVTSKSKSRKLGV